MIFNRLYTGIDLGEWSIKAVTLSGRKGAYSLKGAAYMRLPEEARHGNATAAVISGFLKDNSLTPGSAAVLMTGHSLMFRHFYLPGMPEKDMIEAVKWEIRKEVAVAPADLVSDYVASAGGVKSADGKLSIIAFAGIRKEIDSIVELYAGAGVEVDVIEVVPTALLASFGANNEWEEGVNYAFLDMGETRSNLAVLRDGRLAFAREMTIGGQEFTSALSGAGGGEEMNRAASGGGSAGLPSKPAERLSAEIQRSFDYFQAQFREGSISRLFLSGGSALLPSIARVITDSTGIQAFVDDPFRKVRLPAGSESIAALAPCFSVAMGLAVRAAER